MSIESQPSLPESSRCPSCRNTEVVAIYSLRGIPVHSVLLLPTAEAAISYKRGNLDLGFCAKCGLISNYSFDPTLQEYSTQCEEGQGCSETFSRFQRELARSLVERHDLRGKRILEIGCGKGEFLTLLCEIGDNAGIGFDPAYVPGRLHAPARGKTEFIQDFYSERYSSIDPDFICCQMTLEHIGPVADFSGLLRKAARKDGKTVLFIQVPDATRIFRSSAFEDVYYEHCSYFTPGSLRNLLTSSGFEVLDINSEYQGQYITAEARAAREQGGEPVQGPDEICGMVKTFAATVANKTARWKSFTSSARRAGKRIVLWGSGSKGVAFLTSVGIGEEVLGVVDINPRRQGFFMAGTGHPIISPEELAEALPNITVAMNSNYTQEISRTLSDLGIKPRLLHL